jgi:hypothetical protein
MTGNEGYWGGGISTISQNFSKSPSILFYPLESSISQTNPKCFGCSCAPEHCNALASIGYKCMVHAYAQICWMMDSNEKYKDENGK